MSKILKYTVFVTLFSSFSMAGQLNLLNDEPEKIEYYGRDYNWPPVTIKLAKGSKLYRQVEKLLSDDGWFFGIGGSKLPEIYVVGKDNAFSVNIEPSIAGISYTTKQGRRTWRINNINEAVYNEIEASILKLIEVQKKNGSTDADKVIFPKEPEPYVPETLEDMIAEEITTDEIKKLCDISLSDADKLELIGEIFSRIQKTPAYPEALKKELQKEKGRLTDNYLGLATEFEKISGDVNLGDLGEVSDSGLTQDEAVEDLRVTKLREQEACTVLEGVTDPARSTKSLGIWKYVVILLMLGASAIMISKRKC